jgi:hypothetical protein
LHGYVAQLGLRSGYFANYGNGIKYLLKMK